MHLPVVSAVGHEQDTPLCDLAADVRASTPTHAARLVVPDIKELRARSRPSTASVAPRGRVRASVTPSDSVRARAAQACAAARARTQGSRLATAHARLGALSPTATLERGYAIVRRGEEVVRAADQVDSGDAGRCASPRGRSERSSADRAIPSFEEAQRELEQIVERLERGDEGVEELTKLWERGEELFRICSAKLDGVRGKIEELSRESGS